MPQCDYQVMNGSGMVGIKGSTEKLSTCINIISLMPTRKVYILSSLKTLGQGDIYFSCVLNTHLQILQ